MSVFGQARTSDTYLETVRHDLLRPRPRTYLAEEHLERLEPNPCLGPFLRLVPSRQQRRRRERNCGRGLDADRLEERVVDEARLLLGEPLERAQVADCGPLRERLDAVHDLRTVPTPLRVDRLVCDDGELAEGDEEELLKARDRPGARVGRVWVRGVAQRGEVFPHEAVEVIRCLHHLCEVAGEMVLLDKLPVILNLQQLFAIDLQNGCDKRQSTADCSLKGNTPSLSVIVSTKSLLNARDDSPDLE